MEPERRCKSGMDGGLRAAVLISPPLHLRMDDFLSNRWGPPQQYTALLVGGWNDKTSSHRKAIEQLRPGLIDLDSKGTLTELTKADAALIYTAKPDSPEWELRFHFVELLNHLEAIAAAYRNEVADQQMLEESFRSPLIRIHDILVNFIAVVNQHRGYEAWEPYSAVVGYWKTKPFKKRPPTA